MHFIIFLHCNAEKGTQFTAHFIKLDLCCDTVTAFYLLLAGVVLLLIAQTHLSSYVLFTAT